MPLYSITAVKVAHIITRLIIGGAQENTVLNCEDLVRDYGDEVLLITGPPLGPEGSLLDRVNRADPALNKLKCVIVPSLRRAINPLHDIPAYFAIRRILKNFKPDVVHTHSAKAGILGRFAAHSLGVPVIVHGVHGAPFYPYQNRFVRDFYIWSERQAAKRCNKLISVADAMTELMVEAKVAPPEKFCTIYSGMEVETFLESAQHRESARRELGFTNDEIVVGKIARLFNLKGHEYVIQAAEKVIKAVPNVRFLFVGDGILTEKHKHAISAKKLDKYFTFTGLVSPDRIPAMISATDIVVHTSLREGLARVLPQALLSGKPVISYDIDGAKEVVINNETGFLVPPQSVDELADRIIALAQNEPLRHQMGETGTKLFAQQFDHHYMTKLIREVYLDVRG